MKTLFTNARLIDPESDSDAAGWLLVEDGGILDRGEAGAPPAATTVDCAGRCLAPGIIDNGVKVGEPGLRVYHIL
jgi:dihydroorotase